jgi:hypothetical protein
LQAPRAQLSMAMGRLGLGSAHRVAPAPVWASWAKCVSIVNQRHPDVASHFVNSLENPSDGMSKSLRELLHSDAILRGETWMDCLERCRLEREVADAQQSEGRDSRARCWPSEAMSARANAEPRTSWQRLNKRSRALLLSQSGPMPSKILTIFPRQDETPLNTHYFRTILLRRLRLPLSLSETHCRRRGALDALGDHRAACSSVDVLGPRGVSLEKIAARICREAGARVSTSTYLRDLNLDSLRRGERKLQVIANGLPCRTGPSWPLILRWFAP